MRVFFVREEWTIDGGTVYFKVVIKGSKRVSGPTLSCPIDFLSIWAGFGLWEQEDFCMKSVSVCVVSYMRRCDVFRRVKGIESPECELAYPCGGIKDGG